MTQEYLRECFDYDPSTGLLVWKHRPVSHFACEKDANIFNAKFPTKPAGLMRGPGRDRPILRVGGKIYKTHRIIWVLLYGPISADTIIDHIDGDAFNNRPSNLRMATKQQNQWNAKVRSDSVSKLMGVSRNVGGKKWSARIRVSSKRIGLGSYPTKGLAAVAVAKASIMHHGEFSPFLRKIRR